MTRTRRIIGFGLALALAIALVAAIRWALRREEAEGDPREPRSALAIEGESHQATREQLYREAQRLDIPGRSTMNKQQLRDAVEATIGAGA